MAQTTPALVRNVADLRTRVRGWRRDGLTIALVPTMGALHAGHLALIRLALAKAERCVVSLFVNPRQFNDPADLARYPRQEAADVAAVGSAGGHLVFAPTVDAMYAPGFATSIEVGRLAASLCGAARPGHFAGVATVVAKLLLQVLPDVAIFGEKDYQQLLIIKRMVKDLDIPVAITGGALVRDSDGLALSSRNQNLTAADRQVALALPRALATAAEALAAGRHSLTDAGFSKIDYFDLRDAEDLTPMTRLDRPARLLAAGHVGPVRLIDNMAVAPPSGT